MTGSIAKKNRGSQDLFWDLYLLTGLKVRSIVNVVHFLDLRNSYIELVGKIPEIVTRLNSIIKEMDIFGGRSYWF